MKKIYAIKHRLLALFCGIAVCVGCTDLDKVPTTQITVDGFFKTADDLKSYVNGLYNDGNLFPNAPLQDAESDNVTIYPGSEFWSMINSGLLSPSTVGGWNDWGSLRRVNLMLTHAAGVSASTTGAIPEIQNSLGIAHYFRAYFYSRKVFRYSDVPWINKALESNDPDVYRTADPRTLVVDSILADLEFAAANISADMGNKTRIHKYVALALLSRFCLFEGTYRKYHPELNLASTANRFLERAVSASEEIMNSQVFEITGISNDAPDLATEYYRANYGSIWGAPGYRNLNRSLDLKDNKEIIQWIDYHDGIRTCGNPRVMEGKDYSLTRSLQESYLLKDGKPFSTVSGYATKPFMEVFVNRDPRMAETMAYPGCLEQTAPHWTKPTFGGYDQVKFYCLPGSRMDDIRGYGAILLYRYAEVLLNYAEAKAELGQLTQADLDRSINLLRDRVDMPRFDAAREVDADLRALYPGVTDNALLAIRRERRVELACEGLRNWDLHRWYAGKLVEAPASQQGAYLPALGAYDVTGNGIADIGIIVTRSDIDKYADVPKEDGFLWMCLDETPGFYLENENNGYIRPNGSAERTFVEPKYYYRPIPIQQTTLNPDLKQPIGWQ